jgi:hypothetical protein
MVCCRCWTVGGKEETKASSGRIDGDERTKVDKATSCCSSLTVQRR